MLSLVLFFLTAFGIVYLIVESAIVAPFRIALAARSVVLEAFLYCAYCTGFWIGAGMCAGFQSWNWDGWSILSNLVDCALNGAMVMGLIAFIRGFTPAFLSGAWEHEREIIAGIRQRLHGSVGEGHGGEEGDGGGSE